MQPISLHKLFLLYAGCRKKSDSRHKSRKRCVTTALRGYEKFITTWHDKVF